MKFSFARTTGLEEAKAFLVQALSSGKFPHALLIHGPEGVGQNALLLDLADILLCESAVERPCGKCGSCLQAKGGNSERLHVLLPIRTAGGDVEKGELESPQMDELIERIPSFQGDPYGFGLSERDEIRVVQSRDIQMRLGYAGAGRRSQVVLVPWAETFNHHAANALLKTLEEPPSGVHFLLSSTNRKAILPTILSRCTSLPVAAMDDIAFAAAIAARKEWWMEGRSAGDAGAPPARLAPFAEGSLGALLNLHRNGGEALLEESVAFLDAALQPDWRVFSDYLDGSPAFDKMDTAAPLLSFLLRVIRAMHRLRVEAGPSRLAAWIPEALERHGWDASLAGLFASMDRCEDLSDLSSLVETVLDAVQHYAKPRMAALGSWLERETRASAAGARSTVGARPTAASSPSSAGAAAPSGAVR